MKLAQQISDVDASTSSITGVTMTTPFTIKLLAGIFLVATVSSPAMAAPQDKAERQAQRAERQANKQQQKQQARAGNGVVNVPMAGNRVNDRDRNGVNDRYQNRNFAAPKNDRDNDGILNRFDNRPNVPTNSRFNDRDRDGIPNRVDNRPNVPNNRSNDRDHDGIPNQYDRNPNGPNNSNIWNNDRDHDGIPNNRDRNPDVPNTSNRWNDSDHDGIPNNRDRNPNTPNTSNRWNDRDHDGIPNQYDRNPNLNNRRISTSLRFNNWTDRRQYLNQNLRRFNQIAQLNALQQQQLDAQMRQAYLSYHNNSWNGPYNYDVYSEPQFLDYLQTNQPSLLDRILGYLGVGMGGTYGSNLYSSDWNVERDELARNLAQIHQLRLEGRISASQEQQLLDQLRVDFNAYRGSNYNGAYGWSTYSNPGFIDYLNTSRPSVLTTIRSYLGGGM